MLWALREADVPSTSINSARLSSVSSRWGELCTGTSSARHRVGWAKTERRTRTPRVAGTDGKVFLSFMVTFAFPPQCRASRMPESTGLKKRPKTNGNRHLDPGGAQRRELSVTKCDGSSHDGRDARSKLRR